MSLSSVITYGYGFTVGLVINLGYSSGQQAATGQSALSRYARSREVQNRIQGNYMVNTRKQEEAEEEMALKKAIEYYLKHYF